MEVYKLGVDVGSTHTDAVIVDENGKLMTAAKTMTTPDVTSGIINAVEEVVKSKVVSPEDIKAVMFGTTHGLNAIVSARGLMKVGVIRIGSPATHAIRPMLDWPQKIREAVGNTSYIVEGGHEYTGEEIKELNEDEVRDAAEDLKRKGFEAVAISSVFSPVNPEHERRAYEIVKEVLGDVPITLSHEIGGLGLLERENSTILNSAIIGVMKRAVLAVRNALDKLGLGHAQLFLTQNDGTIMAAEYALKYPIFTVATGASNSIRGAYVLTGIRDAIVVDTGGTTTNVGVLVKGFPRESSQMVEIGGVRTNFRMPDIISVGCAGGSIVKVKDGRVVDVGPESVGYELISKGVAWGGNTLTATDVALALGKMSVEEKVDPQRVREKFPPEVLEEAYRLIVSKVENAVDRIKTSPAPMTTILVGGGSLMLPKKLTGASEVIRPESAQYANAVGAATALVGAEADMAFSYEKISREQAIKEATEQAKKKAVEAGAEPSTIEVVEVDEIAMPYLPGNAVRIKVKVVGKFKLS